MNKLRQHKFLELPIASVYSCQHSSTVVNIKQVWSMAGFSKLFGSMWGGSLYGRFEASAVFMVLLSICDADGIIDMTPEAISGTTGWPLDFILKGLSELEQPDKRSRTDEAEGRRIILLDDHREWGWSITNYKKYREAMRSAERKEYLTEKQRQRREKMNPSTVSQQLSTSVNTVNHVNRSQPIAEAEAEAVLVPKGTMSGKPDGNRLAEAKRILEFLNTKAGRAYQATRVNTDLIVSRLREGYTESQCRQVIVRKQREWSVDDKMGIYLRPATLFNREKFNQYAGELVVAED